MSGKDSPLKSHVDKFGRAIKGSSPSRNFGTQGFNVNSPSGLHAVPSSKGFGSDSRMDMQHHDVIESLPGSMTSVKSGSSFMSHGSRSSIHSQMSSASHESVGSLHGASVMGSAQYVALSAELSKKQSSLMSSSNLPYQQSSLHITPHMSSTGSFKPDSTINPAPPSADVLVQQQMALQRNHAKQQQELYVNQLYEQLSMLSAEHKNAIFTTLQRNDASFAQSQTSSLNVAATDQTKSESDLNKGKSSSDTKLPMFLTSSSSMSRIDKEHLEQLCKTFGEGFAKNILPMPILIPCVTNPWEYKTYLVSLEDVCNMDEYLEEQGRNECGNVNVGEVLVGSIGKTKASLKAKGKSHKRGGEGKAESKVQGLQQTKATFESTQSLSLAEAKMKDKTEVDIFGRDLATQMGVAKPKVAAVSDVSQGSCWEGTMAAPEDHGVKPHAAMLSAHCDSSAQGNTGIWSTGDTTGSTLFYSKETESDIVDFLEMMCAAKKKKRCVIS